MKRARVNLGGAIIAVDVRRFGHAINTDEVFGTHRCFLPLKSIAGGNRAEGRQPRLVKIKLDSFKTLQSGR